MNTPWEGFSRSDMFKRMVTPQTAGDIVSAIRICDRVKAEVLRAAAAAELRASDLQPEGHVRRF